MKKINFCLAGIFFFSTAILTGCNNYGDKVSKGHLDVYYKKGINKEQAEKQPPYYTILIKHIITILPKTKVSR